MLAPSRNRAPLALVALALSDPARSIRLILATHTLWFKLAVFSFCFKYIWWEKEKQFSDLNIRLRIISVSEVSE